MNCADKHDETGTGKVHFDEAKEHIETRENGGHVDESQTRVYRLFEEIGTKPNVIYLKKVEPFPVEKA